MLIARFYEKLVNILHFWGSESWLRAKRWDGGWG